MNDDEKMSSSNTTPFNNNNNSHQHNIQNDKLARYKNTNQFIPKNNMIRNQPINDNQINNNVPEDNHDLINNEQNNQTNKSSNRIGRNQFGPRNRLNNTASNLRDNLNTNTNDMKNELAKKGADKLKKSANPYAKAAGYALSFMQKKSKKNEENKDEENKANDDNTENSNDEDNTSTTGKTVKKVAIKGLVSIAMMILPYLLVFLAIIILISPILNAFSWVVSLFNHLTEDSESYYIYDDNQEDELKREKMFNDAIVGSKDGSKKGIIKEYEEEYGVTLDKYLLSSLLLYRNVVGLEDIYDEMTEDDISESSSEDNVKIENDFKAYFEKKLKRELTISERKCLAGAIRLLQENHADKNLMKGAFKLASKPSFARILLFPDSSAISSIFDGFDETYFDWILFYWVTIKNYKSYQHAYITDAADSMLCDNDGSYSTDSDIGGCVYNNLITKGTDANEFIIMYYSDALKDTEDETIKALVDDIYEYAEGSREIFEEDNKPVSGGVVGDTSIIHIQTCKLGYTYRDENGIQVYNNPPWNEGTDYPDYLNMKDYIKGLVYREIGVHREYIEAMKAQAIAGLTFMINDQHSGFDLKSGEMFFPGGTCRQATCSPTYGCTHFQEPTSNNKNMLTTIVGENSSKGRTHPPLSSDYNEILDEVLNDVFGIVMVKKGVTAANFNGSSDAMFADYYDKCSNSLAGKCFSQQDAINDAKNGMTYTQILEKYYSQYDFDLINITEGLYYESPKGNVIDNFTGNINLNESFHYHQGDAPWGSQNLCDSGSISGNGCNITSAAIVISLLKNQRITPETLNNRQSENPYCKQESRPQMIQKFGQMYGLNVQVINKSNGDEIHNMVEKIASGKYAATARLAKNSGRYSTGNGHYIAIVGARSSGGVDELLVWDPGSRSSSRDNAWVEVNYLVKYLQPDYSFILMGRNI